ncbi:C2H2-type zinc finger protein [Rhodotorula paludigena]|uniref:C2H2-type zinc finger protein n=1 Tax=Rhodotorula paludigena TaxID=86838 RepID=UPI00317332B1
MDGNPFTCLSCQLAFPDAHSQRAHYATELHRYNSRRRVAGLAPVTQDIFDDKVRERTGQLGAAPDGQDQQAAKKLACKACNKTFASAATHEAHIKTKKHKDAVFKAAAKVKVGDLTPSASTDDVSMASPVPSTSTAPPPTPVAAPVRFESSGDASLDRLVAKRLQYAPPIPTSSCLFCPTTSPSMADNVAHMRHAHSFVIPEEEYLVDLEGLLGRLGEEVGTWNVCVCCGKGYGGNLDVKEEADTSIDVLQKRASKGVEAVRAHMQSKSHCRLKYDTEEEQLNIADFYDFRPSYPDFEERQARKAERRAARAAEKAARKAAKSGAAEGWEDVDGEGEDAEMGEGDGGDVEVVYQEASDDEVDSDAETESDSDDDDLDVPSGTSVTYGDTEYELVLPSGARIGHRAHKHIHKQNLLPYLDGSPFTPPPHASQVEHEPSSKSQALLQLVPAMKKDRTHARPLHSAALVPAKGAGFGKGEVIKARNKGEAKEAGKATRHFHELKRYNDQAFVRGIRGNNQKHFRDPLLQ